MSIEPLLNQVHCMDALELMRLLPDGSIQCVLTDPPYGVGTQVSARRSPAERFKEIQGADVINPDWIGDAYRALSTHGVLFMFCKWRNMGEWLHLIEKAGFDVRNMIVWDKKLHGGGDIEGAYAPQHELCLFAVKGNFKFTGRRQSDVIRIGKIKPNDLIHPYQKPVELIQRLILDTTKRGDIVCDPFAGSGTTAIAATKLNRRYIAGDISAEYCDLARKRLAAFTPDMFELFGVQS